MFNFLPEKGETPRIVVNPFDITFAHISSRDHQLLDSSIEGVEELGTVFDFDAKTSGETFEVFVPLLGGCNLIIQFVLKFVPGENGQWERFDCFPRRCDSSNGGEARGHHSGLRYVSLWEEARRWRRGERKKEEESHPPLMPFSFARAQHRGLAGRVGTFCLIFLSSLV
jgi:hypothetical protein